MQFQKEEVKQAILKTAENEFYEHGYEKASIRKIVKASGTTIGNFYNYFENKEALFNELVQEEFQKFIFFLENHDNIEKPDFLWEISNPTTWRIVLLEFIEKFMPMFSTKFIILIESSQGTQYENTKDLLVKTLSEHFVEHVNEFNLSYKLAQVSDIIAETFLQGMITVLKKYRDDEKMRHKILVEYILFNIIGVMGLIGDFNIPKDND